MTIFFSGQSYKYELEGVAKLFFPLKRFTHVYDHVDPLSEGIVTRLKRGKSRTYLWVMATLDTQKAKAASTVPNDALDYDKECERVLCVLLYRALSRLTGLEPAWGILTGIRPVSLVQKMRSQGKTDEDVTTILSQNYLVSPSKISLCLLTATVQKPILSRLLPQSYSLYVSIPFCTSRCSYCSFVSHAINTKKSLLKVDEYVALLCVELAHTAAAARRLHLELDTIYIGGGTPTALSATQLKTITDAVSENFPSPREYTIEAGRADCITSEKLAVIKNAGATRISINPQTFNDAVLREIGRLHTAQDVIDSYTLAKSMGFNDINMDLIAALPTDTLQSFKASVDKAVSLSPSSITVHSLSIKRSSDLFTKAQSGNNYDEININTQMTEYARYKLTKSGYQPYYLYRQKNTIGNLENIGYAKAGYESLYNVYIMDEIQTILACGAGGVTKLVGGIKTPIQRIFNYKYHFEYIDGFDEIIKRKEAICFD